MYNSIYPININYRNKSPYYKSADQNDVTKKPYQQPKNENTPTQSHNTFPNGTRTTIDYAKGQINISQVIADFKNTIIAINAPDDVREEVNSYLLLTEKESLKENPSKEIIVANLKNASRVSDEYIARTLGKQSNVVAGWIDALFLQKINLKANPDEINPDFLLEFPKKAQERIDSEKAKEAVPNQEQEQEAVEEVVQEQVIAQEPIEFPEPKQSVNEIENPEFTISNPYDYKVQTQTQYPEVIRVDGEIELSQPEQDVTLNAKIQADTPAPQSPFFPGSDADRSARNLFIEAKSLMGDSYSDAKSLNLLNEALGVLEQGDKNNENIKAAIHLERGKIFDNYDYVDYALRDYWEATKASDLNLKANAYYKTASIYDEFSEFSPALANYLSSVAYSGEADNKKAQAQALSRIAGLYSKQYDTDKFTQYSDLAIDSALESNNNQVIAKTYSTTAQHYQQLGDDDKALNGYKNALAVFSRDDESYEQMAYNYEQAALVMSRLGNSAKARKLQAKANLYYQKAQLHKEQLPIAG